MCAPGAGVNAMGSRGGVTKDVDVAEETGDWRLDDACGEQDISRRRIRSN